MRALIIGLGSIAQRRVLPALASLPGIAAIDIASRSKPAPAAWPKQGAFFRDYNEALAQSPAELVYISLPNADHVTWIEGALAAGKHVVVDKPATVTLEQARAVCDSAARRGLLLAEATVFCWHAQFAPLLRFFDEFGPLTHVSAQFIIPPLPVDNFRNYAKAGGGCLADMGPYAAAIGRVLGGGAPEALHAVAAPADAKLDVDIGFSFAARYPNGLQYVGQFSFESEYQNRLSLVGKKGSIAVERIFSPPPDQDLVCQVRRSNQAAEEKRPASDGFALFLAAVLDAIDTGRLDAFAQNILTDASFRERIAALTQQDKRQ
ncbi:MAG: Gfo/Idh/MocA family oxidoreductase [Alphaproteobacteria bacterium]|nr:Gfo/Idh/MocA family oxidoreductase [Alphaproteobacteria bacterium]